MVTTRRPAPRFKLGDWVSFLYGTRRVWAQVIEDRGPLGVNRRRLYRLRLDRDSEESIAFELPEDSLTKASPDSATVVEYLKQGGLIEILRSNMAGGRKQPRVWLALDPRGRLIPTVLADRGMIGGEIAPCLALYGDRVFTAKEEEVVRFLLSFGLTRAEAEEVIRSVGTAP